MRKPPWLLGACSLLVATGALAPAKPRPQKPDFDERLPILGTQLAELPAGRGKAVADKDCLRCHSADLIRQQRLTDKQWTAVVTKMIGWGSEISDKEKDKLIDYLAKNFGPDNDRFRPVVTRPVGK